MTPPEARWISVVLRVPPESAAKAGSGAHELHFLNRLLAVQWQTPHSIADKPAFAGPR